MCEENERQERVKILIKLDDKGYYFKEVPYNYIIAKKQTGKEGDTYINLAYYTTAYGALNYYVKECNSKKTNTTVDDLITSFKNVESNIKKVVKHISHAKREYELQNELLKEDIKKLKEQLDIGITREDVIKLKSKYTKVLNKYNKLKEELLCMEGLN